MNQYPRSLSRNISFKNVEKDALLRMESDLKRKWHVDTSNLCKQLLRKGHFLEFQKNYQESFATTYIPEA